MYSMNDVFVFIYSAVGRECANIIGNFEATYCNVFMERKFVPYALRTRVYGQNKIRIVRTFAQWTKKTASVVQYILHGRDNDGMNEELQFGLYDVERDV